MSFTDEDLKRLKERKREDRTISYDQLNALLARLEKAEKVCEASSKVVRPKERIGNAPLERAIFDALEIWKKASGK